MTFTVRERGAGGDIELEFLCDAHGHFEALVPRRSDADHAPCPTCGAASPWSPTQAPLGRVKLGEVSRGKVDAAPFAHATTTRDLAEGMPLSEWKTRRREVWAEHRRQQNKRLV